MLGAHEESTNNESDWNSDIIDRKSTIDFFMYQ